MGAVVGKIADEGAKLPVVCLPSEDDYALQVCQRFVRAVQFEPFEVDDLSTARDATLALLESWGAATPGVLIELDAGATCAETYWKGFPLDLQAFLSAVTAILLWIDDIAEDNVELLESYEQRYYMHQPQLHPILQILSERLLDLYHWYELPAATAMISSCIGFVTGTAMEIRTTAADFKVSTAALQWPAHIRRLAGVSSFWAHSCFPKDRFPNYWRYNQVMPEFVPVIEGINDLLSFYKEDLVDEQHNYVSAMARATGKHRYEVLDDLEKHLLVLMDRTSKILEDEPDALQACKEFERRTIMFHFRCARYKLPQNLATDWTPKRLHPVRLDSSKLAPLESATAVPLDHSLSVALRVTTAP